MPLITTTQALDTALIPFRRSPFLTIDSEFIRENTFWPQPALIQLAIPDEVVLIDPLAPDLDLTPFFDLMADRSILKVFHAARQDIEIIYHLSGIIPQPIFDTQIAAMVCGLGNSIAYDQLVAQVKRVSLSKKSRFTNWTVRPLSKAQLNYAMADVTHLIDVYLYLEQLLKTKNRTHWGEEQLALLSAPETYQNPPEDAWKKFKYQYRNSREREIIRRLAAWREAKAQQDNVPRGHILKDEQLITIAQQQPSSLQKLLQIRRFPKHTLVPATQEEVIKIVQEVLAIPTEDLPPLERSNQGAPNHVATSVELLKLLLRVIADQEKTQPKIIASNAELEELVKLEDKTSSPLLQGWKKTLFGDKALQLLKGELALTFKKGRLAFFKRNPNSPNTSSRPR